MTLIVIPVVYDLLDRKPDEVYTERGRRERADRAALESALADDAAEQGIAHT